MSRCLASRLTAAALGAVMASATLQAAPAYAGPPERDSFVDEFSVFLENFCGVPDLDILNEGTFTGRFTITAKGATMTPYFMQHSVLRQVLTNPATGRSVSRVDRTLEKDLRITDNGDGTSTILVLATGNSTMYGNNGTAIARNPGQIRFEILLSNGGTPSDPDDDEFLEFLGFVKDSTGRSDDYCAAALEALG